MTNIHPDGPTVLNGFRATRRLREEIDQAKDRESKGADNQRVVLPLSTAEKLLTWIESLDVLSQAGTRTATGVHHFAKLMSVSHPDIAARLIEFVEDVSVADNPDFNDFEDAPVWFKGSDEAWKASLGL
jgi:hypothetical protein